MKPEPSDIEEKLIPYLEGVLNPKERREVEEAINTDPELAREMSELRELVLELRQGFASGLKPPQEDLSVEEVVDLSYHTGPSDKLPGSSAQKARLFCSDSGLEEYSLLRALSEEMGRTTLDRENVPELPSYLRSEFSKLGKSADSKPKVLPFLKPNFASKTGSVSAWRRASSWLDRVDPKPLMASAAALVMLSLGVHLYNRPASAPANSGEVASAVPSGAAEVSPDLLAGGMGASAPASASPGIEGVAVFTSDDRSLLKDQAAKLLAKKVRYTVTKDRILVAEKDVAVAREVLWDDVEGKEVAMAKEEPEARRMARTVSSAQSAPDIPDGDYAQAQSRGNESEASTDSSADSYSPPPSDDGAVKVYSAPGRSDAPPPVAPRRSSSKPSGRVGDSGVLPSYSRRDPSDELSQGLGKSKTPAAAAPAPPPAPSEVVLPPSPSQVQLPVEADRAVKPTEVRPPMSAARREKLRDLAVGDSAGDAADYSQPTRQAPVAEASSAEEPPAPSAVAGAAQQRTTLESGARMRPPAAPVTASAPAVVKIDEVDSRLARVQASRQTVARKHGVELSFERQDDKLVAYVRPNRSLDKAQLDELRKTLRKELGLAESDTLIFR